jgi:hypothetical protein
MALRLIVHVDATGQARLLQHVTLMWTPGTTKPDPSDPTKQIVDQPGRQVLVTDDSLLKNFTGSAVRDGQEAGRRISSAAFGFRDPVAMNGAFDTALQSGAITLLYNDPLNPFYDKYHPNHDNLDYDFTTVLSAGKESYDIVRNILLNFTSTDPDGLQVSGWGDTQVGGQYSESIIGLHKEMLHVAGTFRLDHVSYVAVLNDGM